MLYTNKHITVDQLIFILCCLFSLTPLLAHNYLPWTFILLAVWFFIAFIKYFIFNVSRLSREKVSIGFLILFWALIELGYKFFGVSSADIGNYYLRIGFFLPIFIGMQYLDDDYAHTPIILAVLIIITGSVVDNIRLGFLYPNVFGTLTDISNNDLRLSLNFGAVDFGFCALILQLVLLFYVMTRTLNRIKRVVCYLSIIAVAVYLVLLSSATLFALMIIFDVVVLIKYASNANNNYSSIRKIILIVIFSMAFVCVYLFWDKLMSALGVHMASRFTAIITGEDADIYNTRPQLALVSIKSWLGSTTSFFFGQGLHLDSSNLHSFSGQHSAIIDQLAYYGILGLIIPAILLYKYFKFVLYRIDFESRSFFNLFCLLLIINNIVNTNVRPNVGIMAFVFVPMFLKELTNKEVYPNE